jgi:hypothetical protein
MSHDSKVEEMDATQYWRIVGSMRYLIHTHPEGICCRVCEPLPPSCEENPPLHRWDTRVRSTLWGVLEQQGCWATVTATLSTISVQITSQKHKDIKVLFSIF